jgi:hypothetical protein
MFKEEYTIVAASTLTSLQKGQMINGNPVTSSTTLPPPWSNR